MKPAIEDIFKKIQDAEVQTEPFDHLVVDNLLPSDFYKELAKDLDAEDFPSNYAEGSYGGKERFGVDITDYPTWKASGSKIPTTIHQGNYKSLLSGKGANIEFFVNLLLKSEKGFYSLLASKLPTEKLQDNYFFHASMVKDGVGYAVEAHTDDEQNIFTILFYAPETDINKEFGLYVYKDAQTRLGGRAIDFMPNRMIAFAPCKPDNDRPPTWHEVRRLSDKLVGTRNSFQMFFYKNHK